MMAGLPEDMIRYRAEHNLGQRALAKLCNVSVQTINQIELGHQNPSRLTEAKIRRIINGKENKND